MKKTLLLFAVAVTLWTSSARADANADLIQRSYDSEAVGKVADSLSVLDQLSSPRKESYVVTLRRAWLLYRLGRFAESVDVYVRAISLAPGAVEPRLGILLPQLALRRWGDVETQARAVLKLEPGNYLATLRLAYACYNLQRYAESTALYRRLKDLYPSDVEVQSGLGWSLLKQGKLPEANVEFRNILEVSPKHELSKEGLKASGG
jgi:tetratricopeptide (TPR) repeat protein